MRRVCKSSMCVKLLCIFVEPALHRHCSAFCFAFGDMATHPMFQSKDYCEVMITMNKHLFHNLLLLIFCSIIKTQIMTYNPRSLDAKNHNEYLKTFLGIRCRNCTILGYLNTIAAEALVPCIITTPATTMWLTMQGKLVFVFWEEEFQLSTLSVLRKGKNKKCKYNY